MKLTKFSTFSVSLFFLSVLSGYSSELAKKYTLENILIGADIGLSIPLFLTVIGKVFGKNDKDDDEK